jgi:RNA polymerase sigma factor (TIGR02999 family)
MSEITQILERMRQGNHLAAEELLPLVYRELRDLAAKKLACEKPGQTLEATALVHEAFLKLVVGNSFADRQHFFRVAAEAMRQILVDRARQHRRIRHGGDMKRVPLSEVEPAANSEPSDLLALNEALERFAATDPLKAELVKLRYFVGLSESEAAEVLDISRATASRYWAYARAWLINAVDENR